MAVMLVKGYQPDGSPTPACTGLFTDTGCSDPTWGPYAPWAEELSRDGVTSGCGPGLFCPASIVGEWEMLTFLAKAPTTPPGGFFWAAYHPVPRGSTYTFRDEQNRVIREATAVTTGAASATPLTVRANLFLGNTLVASFASATPGATPNWEYYTPDHLGTTRYIRFTGGGTQTHKYWPYGAEATTVGTQRLGFAAMERDLEATHFYDHARTQDFSIGRFTSPDKISGLVTVPQAWNRYIYARNNPLKHIDTDGHFALPFWVGSAAAGTLVGVSVRLVINIGIHETDPNYPLTTGLLGAATSGAIAGGLSPIGFWSKVGASALGSGLGSALSAAAEGKSSDEVAAAALRGFSRGAITGFFGAGFGSTGRLGLFGEDFGRLGSIATSAASASVGNFLAEAQKAEPELFIRIVSSPKDGLKPGFQFIDGVVVYVVPPKPEPKEGDCTDAQPCPR